MIPDLPDAPEFYQWLGRALADVRRTEKRWLLLRAIADPGEHPARKGMHGSRDELMACYKELDQRLADHEAAQDAEAPDA